MNGKRLYRSHNSQDLPDAFQLFKRTPEILPSPKFEPQTFWFQALSERFNGYSHFENKSVRNLVSSSALNILEADTRHLLDLELLKRAELSEFLGKTMQK